MTGTRLYLRRGFLLRPCVCISRVANIQSAGCAASAQGAECGAGGGRGRGRGGPVISPVAIGVHLVFRHEKATAVQSLMTVSASRFVVE